MVDEGPSINKENKENFYGTIQKHRKELIASVETKLLLLLSISFYIVFLLSQKKNQKKANDFIKSPLWNSEFNLIRFIVEFFFSIFSFEYKTTWNYIKLQLVAKLSTYIPITIMGQTRWPSIWNY